MPLKTHYPRTMAKNLKFVRSICDVRGCLVPQWLLNLPESLRATDTICCYGVSYSRGRLIGSLRVLRGGKAILPDIPLEIADTNPRILYLLLSMLDEEAEMAWKPMECKLLYEYDSVDIPRTIARVLRSNEDMTGFHWSDAIHMQSILRSEVFLEPHTRAINVTYQNLCQFFDENGKPKETVLTE